MGPADPPPPDAAPTRRVVLPWRLPNPPAPFLGRAAEQSALAASIRQAPLTRIRGPAGIGKSALARATLHADFPERVPGVLYIAFPRPCDGPEFIATLFRAVQDCGGLGGLNWAYLLRDEARAAMVLIDLIDESGWWVMLDDVQRVEAAEALLALVASYGRRARWIAIGRDDSPPSTAPGQGVALGPLPPAAMTALAGAWGFDPAPADALAEARGAPGRLEAALRGPPADGARAARADDHRTQRLLGALAAVGCPLPLPLLDRLDALPEPATRRALLDRGVIRATERGLELAPRMRPEAERWVCSPACSAGILEWLQTREDARSASEALELAWRLGDRGAARAILTAHDDALLHGGYAPRVAALLGDEPDPAYQIWRWEAESMLGRGRTLDLFRLPVDAEPKALRFLLNALTQTGRWDRAVQIAERCLTRWAGDPAQRVYLEHIRVQRASALARLGRLDDARRALSTIGPIEDPKFRAQRLTVQVHVLTVDGETEAAVELARSMWRAFEALPEPARRLNLRAAVYAFYKLQRLTEAEAVVDSMLDDGDWAMLPARTHHEILILLTALFTDRGRFDEAARCAERAMGFVGDNAHLRAMLTSWRLRIDLCRGDFDGLDGRLRRLHAERDASGHDDTRVAVDVTAAQLGTAVGPGAGEPWVVAEATRMSDPRIAGIRDAALALQALRWGRSPAARPVAGGAPEAQFLWDLWRACDALLAGRPAADGLWRLVARIRAAGLGRIELLAQQTVCEALVLEGRFDALPAEIDALRRLAADSPRFRAAARFFALCLDPDTPGGWAPLADEPQPWEATRRARAVLGRPAALDRIDQRLVAAVQRRWARTHDAGWSGAEPGPTWGLDGATGALWSPTGRLDLGRTKVLQGLLEALAIRGGAADKEALVRAVWAVDEYHPLRHDNRLRVAVRKLRARLRDLGLDDALLTTEDGYALRPPFRWTPPPAP